jgi:uncharacterized protein (TIGR03435 family)
MTGWRIVGHSDIGPIAFADPLKEPMEPCRCRKNMPRIALVLAIPLLAACCVAPRALAQQAAFETISLRATPPADSHTPHMRVLPNGDLIASAVPVVTLLSYAYEVPSNGSAQISPLPAWTNSAKYDIEARAPANAIPPDLPSGEARLRSREMMRALLADRFGLVMQVENKMMPVYALTVAPAGPKLQQSDLTEKDCGFGNALEACHSFAGGLGHPLNGKAITMDNMAHYISNWTDLPVVDRTALSGLYSVSTEGWLPMRLPPPRPGAAPAANPFAGLPTIFTVLGKIGLELTKQEDTLPVYTVERIQRPAIK